MSRTQSDVLHRAMKYAYTEFRGLSFEEVVRKAAEIEFDEGNPREIFDRIGLRPYINAKLEEIRVERWRSAWKSRH